MAGRRFPQMLRQIIVLLFLTLAVVACTAARPYEPQLSAPQERAAVPSTVAQPAVASAAETAASQAMPRDARALAESEPAADISVVAAVPAAQTAAPAWLNYINLFRAEANLPPVSDNTTLDTGSFNHSRYLVKNDEIFHREFKDNQWFTSEGLQAVLHGNLYIDSWEGASYQSATNFWISATFHALPLLDPRLESVGYGDYREEVGVYFYGSTLDVRTGLGDVVPASVTYPIMFPRDGGKTWVERFFLFEYPDTLASCPGFQRPSGPPIILQLGSGDVTPNVTGYSLKTGGQILEACSFDETNYIATNEFEQKDGRKILDEQDAVVIVPRRPLVAGNVYDVEVVANGQNYAWSFSVVEGPDAPPPVVEETTETTTETGETETAAPITRATSGIDWLQYLNLIRSQAGLPPVIEAADLSVGANAHSLYLVKNDEIYHREFKDNPYYTPAGETAAHRGNLYMTVWDGASFRSAIDFWMTAPFHATPILNPKLEAVGYGDYFEKIGAQHFGATLDIKSRRLEEVPPGVEFPILFPKDGGQTWITTFSLFEYPDPLATCLGFIKSTSAPIVVQLGAGDVVPDVQNVRLTTDGREVPVCYFDETSYQNPTPYAQQDGYFILHNQSAIIILPQEPFKRGNTYHVELNTNGQLIEWSFDVVDPPK